MLIDSSLPPPRVVVEVLGPLGPLGLATREIARHGTTQHWDGRTQLGVFFGINGDFHKWGYPNIWIVYERKSY